MLKQFNRTEFSVVIANGELLHRKGNYARLLAHCVCQDTVDGSTADISDTGRPAYGTIIPRSYYRAGRSHPARAAQCGQADLN